jgi:hypothetical protein
MSLLQQPFVPVDHLLQSSHVLERLLVTHKLIVPASRFIEGGQKRFQAQGLSALLGNLGKEVLLQIIVHLGLLEEKSDKILLRAFLEVDAPMGLSSVGVTHVASSDTGYEWVATWVGGTGTDPTTLATVLLLLGGLPYASLVGDTLLCTGELPTILFPILPSVNFPEWTWILANGAYGWVPSSTVNLWWGSIFPALWILLFGLGVTLTCDGLNQFFSREQRR